jgi:hypothetical protein
MLAIGSCQTIPGVLALKMYVHTIRSLQLRRCSHFQASGEHISQRRPSWRVGDVGNLLPNEELLQFTESPDMLMIDRWWDFLSRSPIHPLPRVGQSSLWGWPHTRFYALCEVLGCSNAARPWRQGALVYGWNNGGHESPRRRVRREQIAQRLDIDERDTATMHREIMQEVSDSCLGNLARMTQR